MAISAFISAFHSSQNPRQRIKTFLSSTSREMGVREVWS